MAYFRKRGDKWSFTVDIGVDPITGKRRQKTVSGFGSEKEARKACAAVETDVDRGEYADSRDTVKGFILDYLDSHVKHKVAESTYYLNLHHANNYIIPYLGKQKMTKITPLHIQKFYDHLMKQDLSPGTINNIGGTLGKCFKAALTWGLINKNVVSLVSKPSYTANRMEIWSQDDVNRFLKETEGRRFHVLYLLAVTTGMRLGECLALKWSCISFENATISVKETTCHMNHKIYIKEPKTPQSRRLINIPEYVVSYLKKYKLATPTNRLDLVIPGIKSEIVYNSTVQQYFSKDCKELNMPKIRFHDLRHTHATILLQMGVSPKVIQERLGHSKIGTTLDTYSHVIPSMQKSAADKLNEAFKWG